MLEFFSEFAPHGQSYLWTPAILWVSVVSDLIIAISFISLPGVLIYFARKHPQRAAIESLAVLPAYTSHVHMSPEERALAGVRAGMVRLAIGIEDEADLWADLEQALARVAVAT